MKTTILLLAVFAAVLSSCTTAYKTGQTPDDVYFSKAIPQNDNDEVRKKDKKEYSYNDDYYDDRYLRMKVRNRYRWNDLNDWYNYDRFSNAYNYYYGSYNNPYNSWNYYYNPYCPGQTNYVYTNPKIVSTKPVAKPHNFSLAGYTNNNYNNNNTNSNTKKVYNNSNSNNNNSNGFGKTIRTIFDRNYNNSGSSGSGSSGRTYNPSSSSSSSSSGSSSSGSSGGSSGGSVTRPTRN